MGVTWASHGHRVSGSHRRGGARVDDCILVQADRHHLRLGGEHRQHRAPAHHAEKRRRAARDPRGAAQ
eukprot:4504605-Prymnesium_polylepis.1